MERRRAQFEGCKARLAEFKLDLEAAVGSGTEDNPFFAIKGGRFVTGEPFGPDDGAFSEWTGALQRSKARGRRRRGSRGFTAPFASWLAVGVGLHWLGVDDNALPRPLRDSSKAAMRLP